MLTLYIDKFCFSKYELNILLVIFQYRKIIVVNENFELIKIH